MRHIEVQAYATPPCGGVIEEFGELIEAAPAPAPLPASGGRLSLPIVGQGQGTAPSAVPQLRWRCQRCGRTWDREPLPDEAL